MALRGTLTHRKTRRLALELGIAPPFALGLMEALWHVTAEQAPDGAIGRMSNVDLALEMFFDGNADELVRALVTARLLDEDQMHRLIVHDWHEHADDATKTRLLNNGRRFANGLIPVIQRHSKEQRAKQVERYREVPGEPPGRGFPEPIVANVGNIANVGNVANVGNDGPLLPHPEPVPVPVPVPVPDPEPEPPPVAPKGARVIAMPQALVLPVADPRPDGPRWVDCRGIAARWVMRQFAWTGRALERDVGAALEAEMRRRSPDDGGRGLEELARLMAANWAECRRLRAQGVLQWLWGPNKFVSQAHWLGDATWPYDEAKLAAQSRAGVGVYRGG